MFQNGFVEAYSVLYIRYNRVKFFQKSSNSKKLERFFAKTIDILKGILEPF